MQSNAANQTGTEVKSAKPTRRYDIDWLRVLAVLLLFPFHTTRIFDTWGPFYVKNAQLSKALTFINELVNPWHMPLLFLLAGASTWYALSFRRGGQYAKERFTRLLIPFIFGLLVIVPPQSYFGLLFHSGFSGSYFQWYTNFFTIKPTDLDGYFQGGFTMGHIWFIFYLFLFSLIALPLFLYLKKSASGQRFTGWLAAFFSLPGMIFLLAIPLYIATRLLDFYPSPILFITYFIYGFILFTDPRYERAIDRYKLIALILGPVLYLIVPYFNLNGWPDLPPWLVTINSLYIVGFAPWFFIIAILGYGKQFLNFTNRFLKYTGEASYPVYILHQTVIVAIGFYVVQLSTNILVKYLAILIASVVATFVLYDLLVKRFNITRFLFGMRLIKEQTEVPSTSKDDTSD
jgi:peptidoglycan/LPS O-acetylase OafA/YrhL